MTSAEVGKGRRSVTEGGCLGGAGHSERGGKDRRGHIDQTSMADKGRRNFRTCRESIFGTGLNSCVNGIADAKCTSIAQYSLHTLARARITN